MASQFYKLGTEAPRLKPKLPYINSFLEANFQDQSLSFLGILLPFMCSEHSSYQTFAIMRVQYSSCFRLGTQKMKQEWSQRKSLHKCYDQDHTETLWSRQRKNTELKTIVNGLNQEDSLFSGNFQPVSAHMSLSQQPARHGSPLHNCPFHFDSPVGHGLSSKLHEAGVLQMNMMCHIYHMKLYN